MYVTQLQLSICPAYYSNYCNINNCKFLFKIVSLTELKTTLMFSVSTAVVKWWYKDLPGVRLTSVNMVKINLCTSWIECEFPENCGKYQRISVSGFATFFTRRSYLLRKSIIETLSNTLLLIIVSNTYLDSSSLFVRLSSKSTWSNSEEETRNKMEVTESKHWNHFCLWDLWPPTSTNRNGTLFIGMTNSVMPFVAFLQCKMSLWVGM